jgi:1-phosphofructokinase family hexose kinase
VIVCVAAKPSVDRLFEVNAITPGAIHRPLHEVQVAGGKGLNAARAAQSLGAEVTTVTLLAGHAGRWIAEELEREHVETQIVWSEGESRTSLSVADHETSGLTEFYEDGPAITQGEWEAFATLVARTAGSADWLTISGALPAGAPGDGYHRLDVHCAIAVDTVYQRPDRAALVKVNAAEAGVITGIDTSGIEGALAAADTLAEGGGAACITRGSEGAVLVASDVALTGHVDAPGRYPVGSGDAFLAGIVTARDQGADWRDALALALGAASANAASPGAGRLDRARAEQLAGQALITPV